MADDATVAESDVVLEDAIETPETHESNQDDAQTQTPTAAEDEVTISIDGDSPTLEDDANKAPEWVRNLRKEHREVLREKKELEARLKALEKPEQPSVLGEKPTLAGCDFDADEFEAKLLEWNQRKQQVEASKIEAQKRQEEEETSAKKRFEEYQTAKAALKVPDYSEAEENVVQQFSIAQQSIILQGADRPEVLIYAIGKNQAKAKELSAITDPVKFAMAVAKLEMKLKIEPKTKPTPEKTVKGGVSTATGDSTLDKLRSEAERTGDYSKVHKYKMQLRSKG